ncbi:hypothetical protein ASZ78_008665 [Callipepla squamata]|uniref:Uncharacterized protein n=1 Tax=Callipepla squamata TaxID=9009 RepID=A0A226NLC0_CALSU|nr:hypothetical protein ASZ78_008665 [Callipepla squamata]
MKSFALKKIAASHQLETAFVVPDSDIAVWLQSCFERRCTRNAHILLTWLHPWACRSKKDPIQMGTGTLKIFDAPTEPLLCKFADGGQKKRQNQSKYTQNGRPWPREGEAGMALTYDPTAAIQNGFYSSPYSIPTNRMIPQTSITPFIAASPVSTYQVQSTSWMPHPPYVMQPTLWKLRVYSLLLAKSVGVAFADVPHLMRLRLEEYFLVAGCCDNTNNGPHYVNAASKHDGPTDPTDEPPFLGHNRNAFSYHEFAFGTRLHFSFELGAAPSLPECALQAQPSSAVTLVRDEYMTAAAPMQGTYIPQYTPVPPTAVPIEGVVADTSPQTVASSSQEASGQQQQMTVETSSEHAPAYSYQQSKIDPQKD